VCLLRWSKSIILNSVGFMGYQGQHGQVMEENTIVSEVTFSENAKGAAIADGFQISAGQCTDIVVVQMNSVVDGLG
jgi:hypothetical protein